MDPQVSASFIPKKPLVSDVRQAAGFSGVLFLIALLIFIGSCVLAGAVFLYGRYLDSAIVSKSEDLKAAQEAYNPGVIEDLIRLDSRLANSRKVMQNHIAPSALFSFLENTTLATVQFTDFDYVQGANGTKVMLKGLGPNFDSVALQSDSFGKTRVLKDVLFSDINANESGRVSFTVHANVEPSFILYSNLLAARQAQSRQAPAQQQQQVPPQGASAGGAPSSGGAGGAASTTPSR